MILLILSLVFVIYLISVAYAISANYAKAAKLGLPIVIAPITPDNPLWIAIQTSFGAVLRYFPFAATSFTRHCRLGWEFHDRYKTHVRLGDAWILVTPVRNWLYVADTEAITDIFNRGRDFTRPIWMQGAFDVFANVTLLPLTSIRSFKRIWSKYSFSKSCTCVCDSMRETHILQGRRLRLAKTAETDIRPVQRHEKPPRLE